MNSRALRVTLVLVVGIVLMAIPTLAVVLVGWESAGLLAGLAAMGGIFSAIGLRWKSLLWGALATTVGAFLAVLVAHDPWLSAALMLVVGLAYGLVLRTGLTLYNFMFPVIVAAVIGTPPSITHERVTDGLITAGIVAGSILLAGSVVAIALKKPMQGATPEYSTRVVAVFTFNVTLLFTIIGFVASAMHEQVPGMWLALTVVAVMHPYIGFSVQRGVERAAGTILGFLLALGVASAIPATFIYYAVGLIFLELAILIRYNPAQPYWLYAMFITPGVVLLSGLPSQVSQYADWRLLSTVIAATASLALLGLEHLIFKNSLNDPNEAPVTTPKTT